jgi:hypothetical protein
MRTRDCLGAATFNGGNGGFGGGGGGGAGRLDENSPGGKGGFGGGEAAGGGGLGVGDIFVQSGTTLSIGGSGVISAGAVRKGSGANPGQAFANGIYLGEYRLAESFCVRSSLRKQPNAFRTSSQI